MQLSIIMLQQIVSCSFRRIIIFQVKSFSRLKVQQPLPLSRKADNASFPPHPRDPFSNLKHNNFLTFYLSTIFIDVVQCAFVRQTFPPSGWAVEQHI